MSFTAQLKAFETKAGARMDLVHRKVGAQIAQGIILMTPVDTGHARANWQATFDQPANGEIAGNDPGGGQTVALTTAVAMSWDTAKGGSLFLTNKLPYIERLEEGWSGQAPAGMVRVTLLRFGDLVHSAAADAKRERP